MVTNSMINGAFFVLNSKVPCSVRPFHSSVVFFSASGFKFSNFCFLHILVLKLLLEMALVGEIPSHGDHVQHQS